MSQLENTETRIEDAKDYLISMKSHYCGIKSSAEMHINKLRDSGITIANPDAQFVTSHENYQYAKGIIRGLDCAIIKLNEI